ncbi:MAG TPA: bifunctional diguanylate cyclase/phosphodiesterase [Burkholderiaceae bacterium]
MTSSQTLLLIVAFVMSAGLFWLGAGLVAAGLHGASSVSRRLLGAVGALLAACALWWPGQVMPAHTAFGSGHDAWRFVAHLPGLLLCGAATAVAIWLRQRRHVQAAAGAVALLPLAYAHLMLFAPGVLQSPVLRGPAGSGIFLLALMLALVMLQFAWRHAAHWMRLGAALAVTGLACLAAVLSAPDTATPPDAWQQMPAMAALLVLAAVLLRITHRAAAQEALGLPRRRWGSTQDALTGLPTRVYFESRLHESAKRCDARKGRLAVLFIDLDGFKPVNDTFGHSSGDRVLEQVGKRLRALVRGPDAAARVGGDEFVLLLNGATPESAAQTAAHVIEALSKPYAIDQREVVISCSIGIAQYPDRCAANKLIARADAAMYAAKRAGGSRHCFYSAEMDMDAKANFDLLRDLRRALASGSGLELYFQPKIDARSGKVTAAEALMRWQHPQRGLIGPEVFVPLAERAGLIGPLGHWVIEAACKQARSWRDAGLRMRVAINLSAQQMRQDDLVDRIADALRRHRIHPSLLTCEITESAAMEDTGTTQETFRRLGELGAHVSIDDFGTGYSSLAYLRRLPAEELKIDKSFVKDVDHGADARAVVDAVVKLAHALGLKVVAEGVETPRQEQLLVELGCDELQGFLFAKPMTARALLLWALADRSKLSDFRDSLFGETREVPTRQMGVQSLQG